MKMRIQKLSKSVLVLAFTALVFSSSLFAGTVEQKTISTAVSALYGKLQKDLSVQELDLRLGEVSSRTLSRGQLEVIGTATANEMPISFDVKIDARRNKTINIEYSFIETANAEAEIAEADLEVVLNKVLLDKISADYKTQSVIIAPDVFEPTEIAGKKVYRGSGEVRIGDVDWHQVTFEITVNEQNRTKSSVKYKIQQ